MNNQRATMEVIADTRGFDDSIKSLTSATREFGQVFATTMSRSIQSGKGFGDFLKNLGKRFSDIALKQSLKPLENLFGNLVSQTVGSAGQAFAGGSFSGQSAGPSVVPFARGGVVTGPTHFGLGKSLGLMGEAGPEAILPLRRGADGRLGVASGAPSDQPTNLVFNVQANDAQSFRRSESQIAAMLARAVNRGRRSL